MLFLRSCSKGRGILLALKAGVLALLRQGTNGDYALMIYSLREQNQKALIP